MLICHQGELVTEIKCLLLSAERRAATQGMSKEVLSFANLLYHNTLRHTVVTHHV